LKYDSLQHGTSVPTWCEESPAIASNAKNMRLQEGGK
jgi:hypothetical protein